ncbi:MAG: LysE family translocator [Rhizobiaceae bacterium]
MTIEFLLTSLIVILIPGTGVLYTLAVGLGRGFRHSASAALGCTLGILPSAVAGITGLAALLHASALAYQGLKYAGAAYLLYMAWTIAREGGALDVRGDRKQRSHLQTAVQGMLINTLNPKLTIFFLAFLPQFVPANAVNATALFVFDAAVFMALTFVVFVLYGACAAHARDYVVARPAVMRRLRYGFAATFGLLSVRLALSER